MRLNGRVARAMPAGRPFREAVLTSPVCGASVCHVGNVDRATRTVDGMLFLNQTADPAYWSDAELARMVAEWNDFQPEGVEADPAYLAALCRHVAATGARLHPPAFVTLTYELTLRAHRRAIGRVLDAPLYLLYGATEAGVLFMECEAGRLHHNAQHSHIELVDAGGGLGRVVVTTLGRAWMPLCRYDLRDLVRLRPAAERCPCGLPPDGYLVDRVEGRQDDCLRASDGSLLTPAAIDDLVDAAEPGLEGWQLVGEAHGRYTLRLLGAEGRRAAAALAARLEPGVTVEPRREAALVCEASGKFRTVVSPMSTSP
jgi:phenylacetate-CoA ligase